MNLTPSDRALAAGFAGDLQVTQAEYTPQQAHTVACMDSWAKVQGLATYSEAIDALRTLLDLWHGGHLQVRPEANGAWSAAVEAGEDVLAKAGAA